MTDEYCDCGGANGLGECCDRPKPQSVTRLMTLNRALDLAARRAGARIDANGMVTWPSDHEECGDLREVRDGLVRSWGAVDLRDAQPGSLPPRS